MTIVPWAGRARLLYVEAVEATVTLLFVTSVLLIVTGCVLAANPWGRHTL